MLARQRRRRQSQAMQAFAAAREEVAGIESRKARLRDSLRRHTDAVREALLGGKQRAQTGTYRRAVADIRIALIELETLLVAGRDELAVRRARLLDAMNQRKAADVLKNRLEKNRQFSIRRSAVKELDDLHAARAARQDQEIPDTLTGT